MANTIDAGIKIDVLKEIAQESLQGFTAPFEHFTTQNTATGTGSIKVKLAKAGSTTNKNASTFGTGASNITLINVPVDLYSHDVHVTYEEFLNGVRLVDVLGVEARKFAIDLQTMAFDQIVSGSGYVAQVVGADVDGADITNLLGSTLTENPAAFLTPAAYTGLIPTSGLDISISKGAYGMVNGIYQASTLRSDTSVVVAGPEAVAIASGIPTTPASANAQSTIIDLGGGIEARLDVWFDENVRTQRASFIILYGSAVGDIEGAAYGTPV